MVATQCIEVGANIDFDAMVTELASLDALEQRLGRLDGNGDKGITHAAVVAQKDQTVAKFDDVIYGRAISATWKWLGDRVVSEGRGRRRREGFVPMGVLALRRALGETTETDRVAVMMPRRSAPVLMPAHVDLLSQTSPEPALVPEPAPFLHGPETEPADVAAIWRQDLGDDAALWNEVTAICPPSAAEAISLPVWAVRKWLAKRDAPELADVEGLRREESRGRSDKHPVLHWRGPDNSEVLERPEEIRPA